MAVIGKIRKRSGLILVVVGVALLSFVLTDLFQNIGRGGSKYDPTVMGYINGTKITSEEFYKKVEEAAENFKANQQKADLTATERYQLMLQVWEKMVGETVLHQQCEELGLLQENGVDALPALSTEEYADMIQGAEPHPFIKQNFTNPETGKFEPTSVSRFLTSIEQGKLSQNPQEVERAFESEKQWLGLIQYIKEDRISQKYYNLLSKSFYMPKALAEIRNTERNSGRKIEYVGIKYDKIIDSTITPSDADYQAYYDEHKNEFKIEKETRSLKYVLWDVKPSDEDINKLQKTVDSLFNQIQIIDIKDVPNFVNYNSDNRYDSNWVSKGSLSPFIDSIAFNSEVGTTFAPWSENNSYHFARLLEVSARPDSMKASHILVAYSGAFRADQNITRIKATASELADSILNVVKGNPAKFDELSSMTDDPSKPEKGDLGWFADGKMVPQFNEACINGKVGEVVKVETDYGFHIIKITDKLAPKKKIKLAQVDIEVNYSQKTYDLAFNLASQFASSNRDSVSFDTASANNGYSIVMADNLDKMAEGIMGIEDSRKIIKWLYDDATEIGAVSDAFNFSDKLLVALFYKKDEEGIKKLDSELKDYIKVLVIRDLKAKKLMDQYKSANNDLGALALKAGALVDTADFITFASSSLPKFGPEPNILGRVMVSDMNKIYGPFKGEQGIYFYKVVSENKPIGDRMNITNLIMQEKSFYEQRLRKDYNNSNEVLKSIVKESDIEDFRFFFY